jgi:hypothetical protein
VNARAHRPSRRDWWPAIGAGAAIASVFVVLGIAATVRGDDAVSTVPVTPVEQASLVAVPGGVAATSTVHGPFRHQDGRAAGFSYDELGAAIAASNLAPRVTAAAGPAVFEATLAGQCWGDLATAAAQLRATVPVPDPDAGPTPTTTETDGTARALWYRVLAADTRQDLVVISLLADTPAARAAGGLARIDATVRWHDGDWQLRVPLPPASVQTSPDGYTLLAGTP